MKKQEIKKTNVKKITEVKPIENKPIEVKAVKPDIQSVELKNKKYWSIYNSLTGK
jgi:hypothetical protein